MLAARMTFAHLAVSFATNSAKAAGELANGVPPNSASRALVAQSRRHQDNDDGNDGGQAEQRQHARDNGDLAARWIPGSAIAAHPCKPGHRCAASRTFGLLHRFWTGDRPSIHRNPAPVAISIRLVWRFEGCHPLLPCRWSGFDIRYPPSRKLAKRMSNPKLH